MTEQKLANELARQIVAQAAPGEAEFFDDLSAGLSSKGRPARSERQKPLRSGFPDAVQILTPIVIFVAGKVVELLVELVLRKTGKSARHWLVRWFFPRRRVSMSELGELGSEHRQLVHQRAVESAMANGLSKSDAERLALIVVSVVAVYLAKKE